MILRGAKEALFGDAVKMIWISEQTGATEVVIAAELS
jgi:hypothetical protein